uniref:VapC45 PIN like domain-containing protein n=1 Tax=Streptomyces sp. NBC_00003 TaxID=2903608 RepID=A0AAU2V4E2_9ACTN
MSVSQAVVYDESALLALGAGNRLASQFVSNTEHAVTRHVYVPALCLAAADAQREGVAEHLGALEAADIVALDFAGASTVGQLVRNGLDWRIAHAVHLARPSAEWPDGCPVLTQEPELYKDTALVRTIRLPSQ